MPLRTQDEVRAQIRYDTAFVAPRVPQNTTRAERLRMNAFFKRNSGILLAERMRLERTITTELLEQTENIWKQLDERFVQLGSYARIREDITRTIIYTGDKKNSDRTNVARFRQEVRSQAGTDNLLETLTRALRDDSGAILSNALNPILRAHYVLQAEISGNFIKQMIEQGSKSYDQMQLFYMVKATQSKLTTEDEILVDIVFGKPPDDLTDVINDRANKITSIQLTDKEFGDFKRNLKEGIYGSEFGAEGAAASARRMVKQHRAKFAAEKYTAKQTKARTQLWARTEGTIAANDSLLAVGKQSGMDGKVWDTVDDGLVREGHTLNQGDGVIPVNAVFSDGSTNGGSGSVSPYNCRCAVGPALLPDGVIPLASDEEDLEGILPPPRNKPRKKNRPKKKPTKQKKPPTKPTTAPKKKNPKPKPKPKVPGKKKAPTKNKTPKKKPPRKKPAPTAPDDVVTIQRPVQTPAGSPLPPRQRFAGNKKPKPLTPKQPKKPKLKTQKKPPIRTQASAPETTADPIGTKRTDRSLSARNHRTKVQSNIANDVPGWDVTPKPVDIPTRFGKPKDLQKWLKGLTKAEAIWVVETNALSNSVVLPRLKKGIPKPPKIPKKPEIKKPPPIKETPIPKPKKAPKIKVETKPPIKTEVKPPLAKKKKQTKPKKIPQQAKVPNLPDIPEVPEFINARHARDWIKENIADEVILHAHMSGAELKGLEDYVRGVRDMNVRFGMNNKMKKFEGTFTLGVHGKNWTAAMDMFKDFTYYNPDKIAGEGVARSWKKRHALTKDSLTVKAKRGNMKRLLEEGKINQKIFDQFEKQTLRWGNTENLYDVGLHEMGHRLDAFIGKQSFEVSNAWRKAIRKDWKQGYKYIVSEYGETQIIEMVAESITAYMRGEFSRVPPGILKQLRLHDRGIK